MSEFIQLMIMISPYIILIINNKILQLREKKKLNQDIQVYFEKLKRAIKNIIEDTDQSIYYFNYLRQELPHYGKYFGYLTIYENNDKLRGYSFLEGKASIDLWIEKISISYLEEVETIEHQNIKMRDKFFDALKNYANKNYYLDLK